MIHQLRVYEIFEHNKAPFQDRFRDHPPRIMKSLGFEIIANVRVENGPTHSLQGMGDPFGVRGLTTTKFYERFLHRAG